MKNPSRKGRRCLDRGSAITEVGTRPGTILARADDQGQGVEEGLFITRDDDREHHNLKGWDY